LEPEKQYSREFFVFSFCLRHPRLGTGEANLEMPTSTDPKSSNKRENKKVFRPLYEECISLEVRPMEKIPH